MIRSLLTIALRALALGALGVAVFATTRPLALTGCGNPEACTPANHGVGDWPLVTTRAIGKKGPIDGTCKNARIEVITTQADLDRVYANLTPLTDIEDGGVPVAPTPVDFAMEHVIVREGISSAGISWTVVRGDTAVVGILGCGTQAVDRTCLVEILGVPASVTRFETRECESVGCGSPQQPGVSHR